MNRALLVVINALLIVLCCFLVARVLAAFGGELIAPAAAPPVRTAALAPGLDRSWEARQIIISKNLFNASTLLPAEALPEQEAEDLAKTKLPLRLLGTAAHDEASYSWAAVEDLETREHHVVRVGERLKNRADVLRIERRRIVLQNGARREELALEEDGAPKTTRRRASTRRPPARARARAPRPARGARAADAPSVRQLAENRFALQRDEVASIANDPAALLSSNQARILPKYENGQMVGLQVNAIQSGSLWQQIGVQDGDTIVGLNGNPITGQEGGQQLMQQLGSAGQFTVDVKGKDGTTRTVTYDLN